MCHYVIVTRIVEAQSATGSDWFVKWYRAPHWSPIVCGAIIGVAQIPLVLGKYFDPSPFLRVLLFNWHKLLLH
jgi:hypothetical protein